MIITILVAWGWALQPTATNGTDLNLEILLTMAIITFRYIQAS